MNRFASLWLALAVVLTGCPGNPGGNADGGTKQNHPPTVSLPGDQQITIGDTATLTATATDPDGDTVTFAWSLTSRPSGSTATVSGDTDTITFTPDVVGAYVVSVVANDGKVDSTPATATVTVDPPPVISGTVTVTVVDAPTGNPVAGANVLVGDGTLSGTTAADGTVTITDASLTGPQTITVIDPVTVQVDQDLDPSTPDITRPYHRAMTLVGAVKPAFTVPLARTASANAQVQTGTIAGTVDQSLFDTLPQIDPLLSFNVTDTTSQQIRAVVIGPIVHGRVSELTVRDLLGRPQTADGVLPGNLTSDDTFLNSLGSLLKLPAGTDPLMNFVVDAPAGQTKFFVLGVLITIDTKSLIPILGGGGSVDPGALLGSMQLTTLFAGTATFTVTAGQTTTLAHPLTAADLDTLVPVDADVTYADSTTPWAFDPTQTVPLHQAVVTPKHAATATSPGTLADPRLAANLPTSVWVEIKKADGTSYNPKQYAQLQVPADTGVPATDVPYALDVAVADLGDGLMPLGLAFTRVGDATPVDAVFAMPDVTQLAAGATADSVSLTSRGLWPSAIDGAYTLQPGLDVATAPLSVDGTITVPDPMAFPQMTTPDDPGLETYLQLVRPDQTTTTVTSARAYVYRLTEPNGTQAPLGQAASFTLPTGGDMVHLVLGIRTIVSRNVKGTPTDVGLDDPVWDVYQDTGGDGTIDLPMVTGLAFASGDEVHIDARVETFAQTLDMTHWSGTRLAAGPAELTSDEFLATWP